MLLKSIQCQVNYTVDCSAEGLLNIYLLQEGSTPSIYFEFDTDQNAKQGVAGILEESKFTNQFASHFTEKEKEAALDILASYSKPEDAKGFVRGFTSKTMGCVGKPITEASKFLEKIAKCLPQYKESSKTFKVIHLKFE